jgi:hypothetical protein
MKFKKNYPCELQIEAIYPEMKFKRVKKIVVPNFSCDLLLVPFYCIPIHFLLTIYDVPNKALFSIFYT